MTTHTELAAQARRLALFIGAQVLEAKAHHHEGLSEAALCLTRCAAALESTERLAGGGEPVACDEYFKARPQLESAVNRGIFQAGYNAARPAPGLAIVPLSDDPLQGAVDWLLQADGEFFCVANVQRALRIGYNRAKRLSDTAKERAHGITPKEGT